MPAKFCELDPILTWLLKNICHIAPVICHLCNLSLQSGVFPGQLKEARMSPLLKKSNINPDDASSYIVFLIYHMSKLIERFITRRFTAHCSTFSLLPERQSAYRPYHSTETAVLSVHKLAMSPLSFCWISVQPLMQLITIFFSLCYPIVSL